MLSVNLTPEQLELLYDLAREKFNEVSTAWLPAAETEEMKCLSYETILNLRAVLQATEFDKTYANWNKDTWTYLDKVEYLKQVHLVTDEALAQQGIVA